MKGTAYISGLSGIWAAGTPATGAAPTLLTDGGGTVDAIGARTGVNTPVIPVRLNRGE